MLERVIGADPVAVAPFSSHSALSGARSWTCWSSLNGIRLPLCGSCASCSRSKALLQPSS
jgi:hypothetical protein